MSDKLCIIIDDKDQQRVFDSDVVVPLKREGYYVDGILINTTDPEILDDENNIDMDKLKAKIEMKKIAKQMSESIELGIVLAASGGFMDAYSYIMRDRVFANAQTGNMLLLGVSISERNWPEVVRYLFPVLAFAAGIMLADLVRFRMDEKKRLHWRQISVLLEAIVLAGVCFIPVSLNLLANSLTSLACGIQVESFRKIHGNGIATTMCIGNLRSGTQNLCDYIHTKEKKCLSKSILYYGVILCFIIGAVLGNVCISYMKEKAILVCAFFLLAAFIMMFIDREKEEHESRS